MKISKPMPKKPRMPKEHLPGKAQPAGPQPNCEVPAECREKVDECLKISDILDSLPFYVMLVDDQHHILLANQAVQHALGVSPTEIVGKYCPEAIHGTHEVWPACPLEESLVKNIGVEREAVDDHTGRWILSSIFPVKKTTDGGTIFFHMVTDINARKQAEEQLRISRDKLQNLSMRLESVREEERTRMAREIHDELAQTLATVKIYLAWLTKRLPEDQELLMENSRVIGDLIDSAIRTVMRVSTELRPGVLDDFGILPAIKWQIAEYEKWTDIKFTFKSSPKSIPIGKELSTTLFRICNEALTNTIRHAEATEVNISLTRSKGGLTLTVTDNGKGISQAEVFNPQSFGMIGMFERARFWGGDVSVTGATGKGTTVRVTIPIHVSEKASQKSNSADS